MKPVLAMCCGQAGQGRGGWTVGTLALVALLAVETPRSNAGGGSGWDYLAFPQILRVAKLEASMESGTVTAIQAVDLNGDGRKDLAVAWYATDNDDPTVNQRFVSIYIAEGAGFRLACRLNLYVYNSNSPSLSIFRFGTGAMTAGDFDGDGDLDLAVASFYGDELYFIENLGDETFVPHLQFMFGINSPGNFVTPPEMVSADFDGDGRDEVAYIVDPSLYPDGDIIHFWRTERGISDMHRAYDWCAFGSDLVYQWTRSLAVADFDGDGRPDLVFTAIDHEENGDRPVFTIWHGFDPATERFKVLDTFLSMSCSDVAAVQAQPGCAPGVVLSDMNGTKLQYWASTCDGTLGFYLMAEVSGYAGLAPNKGMVIAVGDLDGDGQPDVVTKQLRGDTTDGNQIELTGSNNHGAYWVRSDPTPISTLGFATQAFNGILRPHDLVLANLHGDNRPEIIAGFAASYDSYEDGSDDARSIKVAIWEGHAAAVDAATYLEWRNTIKSVPTNVYESP